MATETTLGRRIMIEATICKDAPAGSAMASKAWADLRALAARAAAAERLARATDDLWASCLDVVITQIVPRERDEEGELKGALDAWRAFGEVQP